MCHFPAAVRELDDQTGATTSMTAAPRDAVALHVRTIHVETSNAAGHSLETYTIMVFDRIYVSLPGLSPIGDCFASSTDIPNSSS